MTSFVVVDLLFQHAVAGNLNDALEPTYVSTSPLDPREKGDTHKEEKEKDRERDRRSDSYASRDRERNPILDVACGYHHTICLDGMFAFYVVRNCLLFAC